ncbi:MAG: IS982 family transposase [Ferruginibacter sp.]|nr:IS982 family transposase [Cytophagales bacterium]
MLRQDKENKLIELFFHLDEFCIALEQWKLETNRLTMATRKPNLCDSELMSICVFYHESGYKCFQYYYQQMVVPILKSYFPKLVSYERFLCLITRILPGLYLFLKYRTLSSKATNLYFIDSKKLVVCHNRRIHSHRVFQDQAKRGKSSTGWFYGFKLHLVINNLGEIMNFLITAGNVADNNEEVLRTLLVTLKGECYGDRGYLSKLFEFFYEKGLLIVTRIRSNMKNVLVKMDQKIKLRKRAVIESVNDILTSVFDIEHSRHRKPINALAHLFSGLIAYCFYENKPSVYLPQAHNLLVV